MTTPDMPRANSESTSKPYNESGPDTELLPGHIPPGYQSWSKVWIPKTNRDSGQEEEDSPLIKPTIHELEYDDEYDKQAINDLITHVEATWYKNASEDIVNWDELEKSLQDSPIHALQNIHLLLAYFDEIQESSDMNELYKGLIVGLCAILGFSERSGIKAVCVTSSIRPLVKTFRESHSRLILHIFEKSMEKLRTRYKVSYNAVSSLIQADIQHMKSLTSVQAASDDITMIDVYEASNTFLLTSPSTRPQNINRDRDYPEEVLIRRFSNVHFPVKESSERDLTSGGQDASSLATPPSSQFDSGTSAVGILLCSHDNETMNTEYTREPLHEDQFESEEDNSKFGESSKQGGDSEDDDDDDDEIYNKFKQLTEQ